MKKIAMVLALVALVFTSCDSDSGSSTTTDFNSTIVVNDLAFKPNVCAYGNSEEGGNLPGQKRMWFLMEKRNGSTVEATMRIDIYLPEDQASVTGTYDFGPGTADDLLVSSTFSRGLEFYGIIGYTLDITDLGDSKFRFVFNDCEALDFNMEDQGFSGRAEGKFTFEE